MPGRLANAEITDRAVIAAQVTPAIAQTVKRQFDTGIDCIGDGEFWTARSLAHYTAHFTGIEARPVAPGEPPTTRHSTRSRASPPKAKCSGWEVDLVAQVDLLPPAPHQNYTYGGKLLTRVDAASDPSRIGSDQVRGVRFEKRADGSRTSASTSW
jgi:hypothetical protein